MEFVHNGIPAFCRLGKDAANRWDGSSLRACNGLIKGIVFGIVALVSGLVVAQEAQRPLAFVGQTPITVAEVDLLLGREAGSSVEMKRAALANAVELLAKQRQALQALRSIGLATSRSEVDLWLTENAPASQSASEADEVLSYLAEKSQVTRQGYLDYISFRLSWQRYLAKHLNAVNLTKHFANQRRRFDGTQFDISLVSIPVPPGAGPRRKAATEKLAKLALAVRANEEQHNAGSPLSEFEKLATEQGLNMISKSRIQGIGDMEHAVIDKLLQLEIGRLSEPFDTAGGVHLVQLGEVYAGGRELQQVQGEVRLHMLVYLLDRLAARGAKQLPFTASAGAVASK